MMKPPQMDTPGQRVKWLREEKKMPQLTLAKAIGIKQPSLSQLERGKSKSPAASTLLRIAAVLEANPEWIMHGRGHPFEIDAVESDSEMRDVFSQLSPAHQAAILAAAKALL